MTLTACHKDDLIYLAAHYDIPIIESALKRDIKKALIEGLVELEVIASPVKSVLSGDHETSSNPSEPEESPPLATPERDKKVFFSEAIWVRLNSRSASLPSSSSTRSAGEGSTS